MLDSLESAENKERMVTSADLIRRGATLLQEPCPRCGGVQIRYQGKVYCLNEDDLDSILSPKPQASQKNVQKPVQSVGKEDNLRAMLEDKLANVSKQLESTTDVEEQGRLLDLVSKYLETIKKLNMTVSGEK